MFRQLWQFLLFVWLYRATAAGNTWTYYLEELETETSDENSMSFDLRLERISPGRYGISGTININYDFKEDTTIERLVSRSASGDTDYKLLLYSVPRQHYLSAINSFYNKLLMESPADCSNLPYFEGMFEPSVEKKIYEFTKCQFSNKQMPQHFPEGFYKIEIIGTAKVQWKITVVTKVESMF